MGKRISKELVAKRRDIVASLLARGMRQTEIVSQLGTQYIVRNGTQILNPSYMVNPKTDQPFDKATISRDTKVLREQWQTDAHIHAEEHFSRQFAELQELKRVAWAAKNVGEIRQCIALEIKLLGTAKPEKIESEWGPETRKLFSQEDLSELTDAELAAIATNTTS